MRISSLVPFGTGRPLGTEQGMRAGDLELSFWVRMDLVASKWICSQEQSCSGYFQRALYLFLQTFFLCPSLYHWLVFLVWPLELTIALGFWGLPANGQQ